MVREAQDQRASDVAAPGERRPEGRSLAPTALLVAVALGVGSLVPVVRDALVAARLGASGDSDAYFLSTYIAVMLVTIFVSESAAPAAVVTLSSDGAAEDAHGGWSWWKLLAAAGGGLTMVAVALALLARPLVELLAPGFDAATVARAARATLATAPAVVLLGLAWLVAAWLNASRRYVLPALVTPLVAVGACLPLLAGTTSPTWAAFGWTIGAGLALVVLLAAAWRARGRAGAVSLAGGLGRARLGAAGAIALPLLLLTLVTQSTEIADRVISSHVGPGALTTVALAKKTIILPGTILAVAVGTVVLPFLARRANAHERPDAFGLTLNLSLFFILPAAALIGLLRLDLVRVLYGRGAFGADDVRVTAGLLGLYALALVPTNLGVVLQRTFATIGANRAPLYPYAAAMACYIPAAWFGERAFGLKALPLSFALAEFAYVAALIVALDRRLRFAPPQLLWPAGVAGVATAGLVGAVLALRQLNLGGLLPSVALKVAVGSAVYAAIVVWLRHPAATDILAAARRRGGDDATSAARVRVGFDMTYADAGNGTGRHVSSLARELAARADVELLPFRAPRVERLPRALRLPANGLAHMLWIQCCLPIWAWRRRVDVLHAGAVGPLHAPCPVVVTIHDALDFHPEVRPSRIWSAYVRAVGVRAARRSQAIVTGSRASAAEVSRHYGIPLERIHVAPYGSVFAERAARATAEDQPRGDYVLMVGSETRRKNFETAFAALARLREQGRAVDFVVVGRVPDGAQSRAPWLRAHAGVGDDELARLYAGARAVIVASRHEGFGLPVIEALALGAPVVASDIPALREVGGDAARYAPPEDANAFARELATVLDDPRAVERARAGQERARGMAWARTAERTVEVYRLVLLDASRGRAWLPTVAS